MLLLLFVPAKAGIAGGDSTKLDSLVGDKLYYLELKGSVKHLKAGEKVETKNLDSAVIKVFNEHNVLVAEYITNRRGRCNFKLPLNRKFIVEVSKPGFVAKRIEVNTKVPPEKKLAYIFPFSIDIFEEVKGVDVSMLEKPIARIAYLFTITQFDYDTAYTTKINRELKQMYKEYYQLQKLASDSLEATGGSGSSKKLKAKD